MLEFDLLLLPFIYKHHNLLHSNPAGKMSNFLLEDYDAVLELMNEEKQKKKIKSRNNSTNNDVFQLSGWRQSKIRNCYYTE